MTRMVSQEEYQRLVRLTERSFCEIFAQKMLPGGMDT